jgi:Lar family restriction alleviation protein
MDNELRQCPFCGSHNVALWKNYPARMQGSTGYSVICGNVICRAEGPWDLGESGAIAKWNVRSEIQRGKSDD